jgi:CMP-N,N'-diacetyllegionaminic acid synthase
MIDKHRVLALIPARAGSKGLPGKNVRVLGGKPLLSWPIEAARGSRYIDRVVVSTDSADYADIARRHGADVPFLRPAEFASDTAPSISFMLHAIDQLTLAGDQYELLVLLEPTSPLTESPDIDSALESLLASREHADAIVGITSLVSSHPAFAVKLGATGIIRPYGQQDFDQLPRRQDTQPVYALDGSLYISTIPALRGNCGFCHSRTMGHVMPRYKSFEVDDYLDFICIEAILANKDKLAATEDPATQT